MAENPVINSFHIEGGPVSYTHLDVYKRKEDGLAACYKMVESAEGVGELLEELKNNTFKKYDAFTVGEVFNMKDVYKRQCI